MPNRIQGTQGPKGPGAPGNVGRYRHTILDQGTLLAAPVADTIGFSLQGNAQGQLTSATLVGSINTVGLSGSWWFTYGLTPAMGTATAPVAVTTTSTPETVSTVLGADSVVSGQEYWFAVVAQSAGGTTVGSPLTFVPGVPTTPTTVASVAAQSTISSTTVPHFAWPFKIRFASAHSAGPGGGVVSSDGAYVVQQDSDAEINSCVSAICACPIGAFQEDMTFGIPDYTFTQAPVDIQGLAATILRWEGRATEDIITNMIPDGTQGTWAVGITPGAS